MENAFQQYTERFKKFSAIEKVFSDRVNRISNIRLLVVILTIIATFIFYTNKNLLFAGIAFFTGILLFIVLVIFYKYLQFRCKFYNEMARINDKGLKRLNNEWHGFEETGEQFIDDEHPYSTDLNVFGKSSLYQWLGISTNFGMHSFIKYLRGEKKAYDEIVKNQAAIKELSSELDWRQKFEFVGKYTANEILPDKIFEWAEKKNDYRFSSFIYLVAMTLPWISLAVGLYEFFFQKQFLMTTVLYTIQFMIFLFKLSKCNKILSVFDINGRSILKYSKIIKKIEEKKFKSEKLIYLQNKLCNDKNVKSSDCLELLSRIISASEIKGNGLLYIVVNIIWLWDLKIALKAVKWKKENGKFIRIWTNVIGEIDVLSSLSIIGFENPEWCYPTISLGNPFINAGNLGHPLLPADKRIVNDIEELNENSTAIITGSNMAGKSTFLRSIGINLLLAYMGAPVCAKEMNCSFMDIYSSMNIKDNLIDNISTFYAELLRIKKIVGAIGDGNNICYLVDELFSGTNSHDRVTGAKHILKYLQKKNSIGFVSTHDLELCSLAELETYNFVNFNFKEFYEDGKIYFDYKLNHGPSTTRNAMYLMRMLDLPMDD